MERDDREAREARRGAGAGTTRGEPLPEQSDARPGELTGLTATGIADVEGRADLRRLAEEQAALLRLATLVGEGVPSPEIFSAVSNEVARLFDANGLVLRYEDDGLGFVSVGVSQGNDIPRGRRWEFEEGMASLEVYRTGRASRVDAYDWSGRGPGHETAKRIGIVSSVSYPILVENRLWGAITVFSTSDRLPAETEDRLEKFTRLVGTAIANTETRAELAASEARAHDLAREQIALRRVATEVAAGATTRDVFVAVAREVGVLFGVPAISMVRFDPDGSTNEIGGWGEANPFPVGVHCDPHPGVDKLIWETGRPARIRAYGELGGSVAETLAAAGFHGAFGAPIVVDGRTWGAIVAMSTSPEPPPEGAEDGLASFTELVATAIANGDAHDRLQTLADEQAALRRVATLVAEGVPPAEVVAAVAEELGRVFDARAVAVDRFEPDERITILAGWTADGVELPLPPGSSWPLDGVSVAGLVWRTGRTARVDSYDGEGAIAAATRAAEIRASIASPIVVDGRLWGMTVVLSSDEPFPEGAELRLSSFTDLVATAIANAQAREELRLVAEEQAALRRVATRVVEGAPATALFAAVAEEVARVVGVPLVTVGRYEAGPSFTVVGGANNPGFPVGSRWPLDGPCMAKTVFDDARAARIENYSGLSGTIASAVRSAAIFSAVGAPIVVDGSVWGYISVSATDPEPLPADTEERLEEFTELVATAIANAQAREELRLVADEQAALRRVATLVAHDAAPAEIFSAVSQEVAHVFSAAEPSLLATVIRFDPGPECVLVGASGPYELEPIGSRWAPKELYVSTHVLRTGDSARVDEADLEAVGGADADVLRLRGFLYQVGSPVVMEGRLWGAITLNSREALPPDADQRLLSFTELVATAISNAESREALSRLVDEQAALRRVATLVAGESSPVEIFGAVTEEAARVVETAVGLLRFEHDGTATLVAQSETPWDPPPLGTRFTLDGENLIVQVFRTGQAARVDDWAGSSGSVAGMASVLGVRSAVASPVVVEGRLWGTIVAVTSQSEPLPAEMESRIAQFTGLVATAIANAESRAEVQRLADEQAALRRVATLVAQGAQPDKVFVAVSEEVRHLFCTGLASVGRVEPDGLALDFVRPDGGHERVELADLLASAEVFRTGRSARADASVWESAAGKTAERLRSLGIVSIVSSPIVVEGEVWGIVNVASADAVLPPDTEERLEKFTEIVATAIANADSRRALARLADEQAALRRVATLVAKEDLPEKVFAKVAEEAGRLFGGVECTLLRNERDGAATNVGTWGETILAVFPLETSFSPSGDGVAATVLRTGHPYRIDDYSAVADPIARSARHRGIESSVGCPILVRGAIWGAIVVGTTEAERFPPDTELRLTQFADLVGAAIANAAARDEIERLADEQAALRRVATLVARDAPSTDVFDAVATEVGRLLQTDITVVGRYDGDGWATAIGSWSSSPGGVPVGTRSALGGRNVLTLVAETGKPARVEGYDDASGEAADIARRHGWRSSIAAPIAVEGRVWGVMLVATQRPEPFPAGAEERLGAFTDLVATALANAQAHDEVRRFGDEQAALRRVATLVAAGAAPEKVFTTVVEEVSILLGLDRTTLIRLNADATGTVIAAAGGHPFAPGTTWSLADPGVMATVARTKRAARIDDYGPLQGEIARAARKGGFRSAVGAPITVEGHLWGVLIAISTGAEPIPERSEARLGQLTELVATAIANAESRDAVRRFGEEQAALGRVATLVAAGAAAEQVFNAVVDEASSLLGLKQIELVRYDGDATATVIAGSAEHPFPVGSTWSLDEPSVIATVAHTKRAARIDDYSSLEGDTARLRRAAGFRSAIGAPLTVEGQLWGVLVALSTDPEPIPERSEARLAQFTELVGTAVANAESRDALATLADEQAALRRIATLVAEGVPPGQLFAAVANETATTFRAVSTVVRFDDDGRGVLVVGASNDAGVPIGTRWELADGMASAELYRTGRPTRRDATYFASQTGPVAEVGHRLGLSSQVSCPIVVEGSLWGVITVFAREELPADTEQRLGKFTELVTTAIANAESKSELAASRRRIVAASDETRRQIERDLHDGTQQRLVSLGLAVRAVEAGVPPERGDLREELSRVATGLVDAVEDLQELSRGIHPAILSRGGLGPALETLSLRSAVPVELDVAMDRRLPEPIEVAAYFVASEALANAAKHAQASRVQVSLGLRDGSLLLSVRDDGVGGADAARGSGLVGLKDRVEALGGTIAIESQRGGGTSLVVSLPLETISNTR